MALDNKGYHLNGRRLWTIWCGGGLAQDWMAAIKVKRVR